MASEFESIIEFGKCQENWHSKSAVKRSKLSNNLKLMSFGLSSLITVILMFDNEYSKYGAALLTWISSIILYYLDQTKFSILGAKERIVAEKLRLLNAQFSAKLINEETYSTKLISILTSHVDKYEELIVSDDKTKK